MFKIKFLFLLVFFSGYTAIAQYAKSQLETRKQAVFINSIVSQISGFQQKKETYTIAILKNSDLYKVIKESNRKLIPINYSNLVAIKDIDILYVHASSNYRIEQLLDFVHDKPILLITEDYEYRTSMINIISAQGAYYVDVDKVKLNNAGFTASENFNKSIVSNEQNWNLLQIKKMYDFQQKLSLMEEEQKELTQVKEILIEEKQEILNREEKILNKLSEKDEQIEKEQELTLVLKKKTVEQQKEYYKKLDQLKDLEQLYSHQEELVIKKQKELENQSALIDEQNAFFTNQKEEIDRQAAILGKQSKEIEQQRQLSFLLMGIVVLISLFVLFVFKMRAKEKRLIRELEEKNKKIEKTSTKLKRQNKELEKFAYIASHDLQEPLHTVSSFADFMIEDYNKKLDETGLQYLNFMKQGCKRMSNLITALLDYSKIGAVRNIVVIESSSLIKMVMEDFTSLINKTNTQISYGEMPVIQGYEVELRLLFQNLISNAIKFRKPNTQPKIHIEGKKIKATNEYIDSWQFAIKDNGIGIAQEHHHKIFSIFKRLHNLEEYQGTGIGLAHCEKIITLHNGNIWLESKPGLGTTFFFTIQLNKKNSIAA